MGRIINFFIILALFLYILSYPKGETKEAPKIEKPPVNVTTTTTTIPEAEILNYSEVKEQIRWINRTVYNIVELNITNVTNIVNITYETMNITGIQQKELMNMKPDQCFTGGCSDGFDKAKRECLAILELKAPKYRETFGSGYDPFRSENESQATFLYNKSEGYIPLNGTFWYVTVPFSWEYINETTVRNGTLKIERELIKLRRVSYDEESARHWV